MALLYTGGNGSHLIDALDGMTAGFNVIISGLAQILVFMYFSTEVTSHPVWFASPTQRTFSYYALKYFSPLVLVGVFGSSLLSEIQSGFGVAEIIRWGWFAAAGVLAIVLARKK